MHPLQGTSWDLGQKGHCGALGSLPGVLGDSREGTALSGSPVSLSRNKQVARLGHLSSALGSALEAG